MTQRCCIVSIAGLNRRSPITLFSGMGNSGSERFGSANSCLGAVAGTYLHASYYHVSW
jgi:hypothetical protein